MEAPLPSELKISTMTVISNIYDDKNKFNEEIKLDILSRIINIYDQKSDQLKSKEGGITNIDYYTNLPRNNVTYAVLKTIKNNPFFNQMSVVLENFGFKKVNIKIFNNGKLQMTGILSESEAKYISLNIISILKQTKLKIYTHSQCLKDIKEKHTNDYVIVYNPKNGKMSYYRWNYLNIIDIIEKNIKDKLIEDGTEREEYLSNSGWVSDSNIAKFITILGNKICELKAKNEKINSELTHLLNHKSEKEDTEKDSTVINDEITKINSNIYELNKQKSDITKNLYDLNNIFKKVHNVRKVDNDVLKYIYSKYEEDLNSLHELEKYESVYEYDIINNIEQFKLSNIKVELINSDYSTNFMINNTKLYNIVQNKYKAFASYEPNDYPGVKNKFFWNADNIKAKRKQGKCYCETKCVKKGKKSACTQITISVFQSGSVIITGAKSIQQIKDGYDYINTIFRDNYNEIKGVMTEEDKIKKQEKLNNDRKIMRKKRLFYFKKTDLFPGLCVKV